MIVKRLHTNSKIFFPNPYVVRVEYSDMLMETAYIEYRKLIRRAYKLLQGTWGYSPLDIESWPAIDDPIVFNQLTPANQLNVLFTGAHTALRAYVFFADEHDALQFRLSLSVNSVQVLMWPTKRTYTIHESVEIEDES